MEEARMDRRTFVMGAAAIGAAALAGGVLGGCSDGEEAGTMTEPVPAAPSPTPEPAPGPLPYDSVFPPHEPLGRGVGAMPGRVAWVRDAAAVTWDGSGYWRTMRRPDGACCSRRTTRASGARAAIGRVSGSPSRRT